MHINIHFDTPSQCFEKNHPFCVLTVRFFSSIFATQKTENQ